MRHWDKKLNTVKAVFVNLVATKYLLRGKNLIVHYLQPHPPFIAKTRLRDRSSPKLAKSKIYELAAKRSIVREKFRRAYIENLRYVLRNAKKLIQAALRLGYRVVITSDHSELLGVYAPHIMLIKLFRENLLKYIMNRHPYVLGLKLVMGHPCSWPSRELYEVPWVEVW